MFGNVPFTPNDDNKTSGSLNVLILFVLIHWKWCTCGFLLMSNYLADENSDSRVRC